MLVKKVTSLAAELAQQKALVAELLKRLYGAKREQMDTNQLLLRATHGIELRRDLMCSWHKIRANHCLENILIDTREPLH